MFQNCDIISNRMSQHAAGLMAQLSQIVERSPSPYWDLLVVCRDGTVRWGNTQNEKLITYSWNFRQNKAMLIVVFPFLLDYSSILDTSLDNMTVFLPDFTINDLQTAVRKPFLANQTQLTGLQGRESTGTVSSQKPAGWIEFTIIIFFTLYFFRENCSVRSMRQNCIENIIK